MGVPALLYTPRWDLCLDSPTISTLVQTTSQEPTCLNDGNWKPLGTVTLSKSLGSLWEIQWWYTTSSTGSGGWTMHQQTASLTNIYPNVPHTEDYGTDGDGPASETIYHKVRAIVVRRDYETEECDSMDTSQANRVLYETCAA
jgi:hypothetical protein